MNSRSSSLNTSNNLSNSITNQQESQLPSSNGEAFKHANEFEDTISKLNTVREDSGEVFVEGDTVDRARPRRSVVEVHQERDIPAKAPVTSRFKEDQLSVNNEKEILSKNKKMD